MLLLTGQLLHTSTVDGGYGPWSEFGACSVSCGEGVQQRERKCDSPEPNFGGETCEQLELGSSIETKACSLESCPGRFAVLIRLPFSPKG